MDSGDDLADAYFALSAVGCSIWTIELLRRSIESKLDLEESHHEREEPDGYVEDRSAVGMLNSETHIDGESNGTKGKSPRQRINAILLDYFLYDSVKAREAEEKTRSHTKKDFEMNQTDMIPHHRTRSVWY